MRLLNSETLELHEFSEPVPEYAILSHTWGKFEVTLQDIESGTKRHDEGFIKIRNCCAQVQEDGYDWVWIDTCCIDKTSSAELSEAINSMFKWYAESAVCYVYLSDVPAPKPHFPEREFRAARWFTRGWCLQELVAPRHVEFYAAKWTDIGTRESLMDVIHDITGIDKRVLGEGDDSHDLSFLARETARLSHFQRITDRLSVCSAAERMSWASMRQTSRTEDMAYCLLGIFQINMPLLYGEGSKAFYRLQEEILRHNPDLSLFLWCTKRLHSEIFLSDQTSTEFSALASSPEFFSREGFSLSLQKECKYHELTITTRHVWPDHQAPWRPAQLMGGSVLLQMAVGRSRQTKNRNSLIAWTGFECRRGYVCIELLPVAWGKTGTLGAHNANMYGRHGTSRVILLGDEEYSQLRVSELYLNLKSVSTEMFTSRSYYIVAPNVPADLRIKIPFNGTQRVFLMESFPPQTFVSNANGNAFETGQPLGTPELYCESLHIRQFERCETLQLKLRVNTSNGGSALNSYVILDLALRYSFLRCKVTPCVEFDSLEAWSEMNRRDLQRFHSGLHERTGCFLSDGGFVYVLAKPNRKLSRHVGRSRDPATYTIQIKVQPPVARVIKSVKRQAAVMKTYIDPHDTNMHVD